MFITINYDSSTESVELCSGEVMCLLWGTNFYFICKLEDVPSLNGILQLSFNCHKSTPPVPILNHINPVHNTPCYLYHIILISSSRVYIFLLSSSFLLAFTTISCKQSSSLPARCFQEKIDRFVKLTIHLHLVPKVKNACNSSLFAIRWETFLNTSLHSLSDVCSRDSSVGTLTWLQTRQTRDRGFVLFSTVSGLTRGLAQSILLMMICICLLQTAKQCHIRPCPADSEVRLFTIITSLPKEISSKRILQWHQI
jgi:hypothetical protein